MKNLNGLNRYRVPYFLGLLGDEHCGKFLIPMNSVVYQIWASDQAGWDHVSISVITRQKGVERCRIANYQELEQIRALFFEKEEPVIEIHPEKKNYVNNVEYVLHLWKPNRETLPLPPQIDSVVTYDVIPTNKPDVFLKVSYANKEDWDLYEVSVVKGKKLLNRYPSWDEMCIVKKYVSGEDAVAFHYHTENGTNGHAIRLWIPPKKDFVPLPDPLLVGFKDFNPDQIKQFVKTFGL